MKTKLNIAFGAVLGVALLGSLPAIAGAQNVDYLNKTIPSLDYQGADVREAIRALFRTVNASYTIAPEVQGTITVSLKGITFESALQNITRQVDATYHIEGGIVNIIHRIADVQEVTPGGPQLDAQNQKVLRRIKIRSADPAFIAALIAQAGTSANFNAIPERTTITNARLIGGGGGGGGGGGFGGGGQGGGGGFGGGGGGGFGGGGGGGMGGAGGGGFGGGGGGGFGGGRG